MTWRSYSWKAITCCLSKGMLVTLLVACILAGAGFGIVTCNKYEREQVEAQRRNCDELDRKLMYTSAQDPTFVALLKAYEEQCVKKYAPMPSWLGWLLGGGLSFLAAVGLLSAICRSTITYCQVAVDTGRRPWYFLPWIGDPVPPREQKQDECPTCKHVATREETENEYRTRLGLAPLG